MNNQKASPASQLNLPFDSLSIGKERGKLYQDRDWLYQKYWIESLSTIDIANVFGLTPRSIWLWLKKNNIEVRTIGEALKLTGENKGSKNPNWQGGKYQIKFKCIECGRIFKSNRRTGNQDRKFCSMKCKDKFHSDRMAGDNNPNFKNALKEFKCLECGKNFMCWKRYIGRRKFCSMKCSNRGHQKLMKELFKNPIYLKKWQKGVKFRPSGLEKYFDDFTPQAVRYVGDGSWWRLLPNGKSKNPDFKITSQNKIIELYGDYWHRNDDPKELINLYKQVGLRCLVIWENEVYNEQEKVLKKVNKFIYTDKKLDKQKGFPYFEY